MKQNQRNDLQSQIVCEDHWLRDDMNNINNNPVELWREKIDKSLKPQIYQAGAGPGSLAAPM